MKMLSQALCLCLAVAIALADGHDHHHDHDHAHAHDHDHAHDHAHDHSHGSLDRCQGLEMDAVTVNEDGVPYFFKGDHIFKGFHGSDELFNASFAELDDHHLDHVDAAFRMHYEGSADHDHIYFFLNDKVFSYYKYKLEDGYPKDISEVFPGIPVHLDAAVECPKPECDEDSVIFFKGSDIYHYNVKTKAVDKKEFESMPNCTSAFRFMENYYCFHGHMFSKFDPKTGDVAGKYPKEARDYFMRCANFSQDSDHLERERCSRVHLDAITTDNAGNGYAFRGHHYLRKDKVKDTLTAEHIENAFKELHCDVDAIFSHGDHLHIFKDDKVFAYKVGEPHVLMDGYPKPVKEEVGIDGPIDAAFICEDDENVAHIIKGNNIYDVDMKATPAVASNERPIAAFKKIDAATCGPEGVRVIVGNHYYQYPSVLLFIGGRHLAEPHRVSMELFGCDH